MPATLPEVLAEALRLGHLGGESIDAHIEHGRRFLAALPDAALRVLDLGSGGGIPGLVLAADRPEWNMVLLDRRAQRTDFLLRAVGRLEFPNLEVVTGDASVLAHNVEHRGAYDAVVARAFGPPAATAEAAAGFLRVGGVLVVSEPPDRDAGRWPAEALAGLGLALEDPVLGFVRLRANSACPGKFPRRRLRPLLF
ncbi:MAG: RsmG family class I SAM-dependent methyltransferase [Acidimicrobiales bacterium]